jgi:hypothetical protein
MKKNYLPTIKGCCAGISILNLTGCLLTLDRKDAHEIVNEGVRVAVDRADLPTLTHNAVTTTAQTVNELIGRHVQDFKDSNSIYFVYLGAALLFLLVIFEVRKHIMDRKTHKILKENHANKAARSHTLFGKLLQ